MQKRNTQQRRNAILDQVNLLGEASVEDLAVAYNTSEVTIRKDLAELEKQNLLLRRFGGAIKRSANADVELEPQAKQTSQTKVGIAALAASLIKDRSRIIIDSGSTTSALISNLASKTGLVVMTNALNVCQQVTTNELGITLLSTGGTWDPQSQSFQGKMAENMLRAYNFEQAFIGATGLDLNFGTTTYNELTSLSLVMAEVADEVIVMAESEKLQRKIPNIELPWSKISTLVTDERISAEAKATIEQHGVTVLCANNTKS